MTDKPEQPENGDEVADTDRNEGVTTPDDRAERDATVAGLTAFYKALPADRRNNVMAQVLQGAINDRVKPDAKKAAEEHREKMKSEGRDYGTGTFRGPNFHSSNPVERKDALDLLLIEYPDDTNERLLKMIKNTGSYNLESRDEVAALLLARNPSHDDLRAMIHFNGAAIKEQAARLLKADAPTEQDLISLLNTSFQVDAATELLKTNPSKRNYKWVMTRVESMKDSSAEQILKFEDLNFEELSAIMSYSPKFADQAWERFLVLKPGNNELMRVVGSPNNPKATIAARMLLDNKPSVYHLEAFPMYMAKRDLALAEEAGRQMIAKYGTPELSRGFGWKLENLKKEVPSLAKEIDAALSSAA